MHRLRSLYAAGVLCVVILGYRMVFDSSKSSKARVLSPAHQNAREEKILLSHLSELGAEMLSSRTMKKCKTKTMGVGWGGHALCDTGPPDGPCVFYSYGISQDYTFDTAIASEWGCKGVALDPSVSHPSKLHPNVTFHMIAARTLDSAGDAQWDQVATVPGLSKFLGHDQIAVLKMDCEGCEYAVAEDILQEDPKFLSRVGQFAIEFHVSQKWLRTKHDALQLGLLYKLAKQAGFSVMETHFGGCDPHDEAAGCLPLLQEVGFPCESRMMCVDVLFARL